MAESIKIFEISLKDYLMNIHKDSYHTEQKMEYKYVNLKVYMDPKKFKTPHFWVSSNLSAACFSINPVEIISGSVGGEEQYVMRWAARPNINGELKKHWLYLIKTFGFGVDEQAVEDDESNKISQDNGNEEYGEANEIITGSGVSRVKLFSKIVRKIYNKNNKDNKDNKDTKG